MIPLFQSDLRRFTVNLPPVCRTCGYDILPFQLRGRAMRPDGEDERTWVTHFIHYPACPLPTVPPHPSL